MTDWPSGMTSANGIRLHYYRTGGDKPPVVLLHGITDNALCWRRTARALEPDYDLILIDARGHGLSERPENAYRIADHVKDVIGVIDALDLPAPVLMGHSMGAAVAAAAAAAHPDRVSALILEDPPWYAAVPDPVEARNEAEAWKHQLADNQRMPLEDLTALKREESPGWHEIEFEDWARAKHQASLDVLNFIEAEDLSWKATASQLHCPGLLITADVAKGAIVTPDTSAEAQGIWPGGVRVAYLGEAGHSIHREQFEDYVEAVKTFLKDTLPAQSHG